MKESELRKGLKRLYPDITPAAHGSLMQAVPGIHDDRSRRHYAIPGAVPEDYSGMEGCRFAPRCPYAADCGKQPLYTPLTEDHLVRCEKAREVQHG